MTITGESISAPAIPTGSSTAVTGTAAAYSASGAASSLGHGLQYRLSWGDGSTSGWLAVGTTSASHSWPGPGNFTVTAQARCAADTQVLSAVSPGLTVTVTASETISTPATPSGPSTGLPGSSYTYSTSGAISSSGNAVSYLFDWGDGKTSGWLAAGVTSASHTWVTSGTYTVTALAADATALLIRSSPSGGVTVTITPPPPSITSVSPTSGAAGARVTIAGLHFGSVQGQGVVWLGSTYGTVVSWSDTQIVATVTSHSISGKVQVLQGGVWSNTVPFTVNTATISSVVPASGVPGTQVTITGTFFGATQGSSQVWLGSTAGVVPSWSDTQIVAQVAAGATSAGGVRILQNGVLSPATPFTVNTLRIASLSPTSGVAGTSVTFTGAGFGASQGSGAVWLGSTAGQVISWSDTQVVATVASTAVSGIARIQQNGVWSNTEGFTVPVAGGNTVMPSMVNMVVGDARTLQALSATGQTVTGLTWTSSNTAVVSLSTDDPPVLTALAVGHVTITAGTASADVTVSVGELALGTVIWSNPGNGSGVYSIVPAVPSSSGVADVFAFQNDGTVQAIRSDGTTAWTANVSQSTGGGGVVQVQDHAQRRLAHSSPPNGIVPDFQGGLVVRSGNSIVKLDGITGYPYPAFSCKTACVIGPVVYPDGTILVLDGSWLDGTSRLVGIDPLTAAEKFRAMPQGRQKLFSTSLSQVTDMPTCPMYPVTTAPLVSYTSGCCA